MLQRDQLLYRNQKEIQEKLQNAMADKGLSGLVLTRPESIYYCTGYASSL